MDLEDLDLLKEYLSEVSYVFRSSYHQSHGHLPAQLVFRRDMFSAVPVAIDWNAIKINQQIKIYKRILKKESLILQLR